MQLTYTTRKAGEKVFIDTIEVVHDNNKIVFHETDNFYKTEHKDHENTFHELNGYIAACINKENQQKMFNCFRKIRDGLDSIRPEPKALLPVLVPLVTELYSYTSINDLNVWMYKNNLHLIPDGIPDVIPSTKEYPPETTYIKSQYVGIINLSVLFHLAAPFLGDYITKVAPVTGSVFKETAGLALFQYANIMESKAMIKLRNYVTASCSKKPVPLSAALEGLSEERFPDWLLGNIISRKLAINHVRRGDDSGHIVAAIHAYIGYNTKLDGKFGGGVMPKDNRDSMSEDERDKPIMENWKMKTDIYDTDIVVCSVAFDDIVAAAQAIIPSVPASLVNKCYRAIPKGWNMELSEHQKFLMSWIISMTDFAPAESVNGYYDYDVNCRIIAIAQAIYWHLGHVELAVCVGTYPAENMSLGSTSSIIEPNNAQRTEIESLYHIQMDKRSGLNDGLIHRTMVVMVQSLLRTRYAVVGPDELLAASGTVDVNRCLIIPNDIVMKLHNFIKVIVEISKTQE